MIGGLDVAEKQESLLEQLFKLIWEKTSNIEAIQTTYEREITELRSRVEDGDKTIKLLTAQLDELRQEVASVREVCAGSRHTTSMTDVPVSQTRPESSSSRRTPRLSLLKKGGTIEGTISASIKGSKSFDLSTKRTLSVASDSAVGDITVSPELSKSLQDVLGHLDFLNNKNSAKVSSISSFSVSDDRLELFRPDDVFHDANLSYDTSFYNGDSGQYSDNEYEDAFETNIQDTATPQLEQVLSTTTSAEKPVEVTPPTGEPASSPVKRTIVTESTVSKHPVLLSTTSVETDPLVSYSPPPTVGVGEIGVLASELIRNTTTQEWTNADVPNMEIIVSTDHEDFLSQGYTRSDTFDVLALPDASQNTSDSMPEDERNSPSLAPMKPKRRAQRRPSLTKNESTEPSSEHSKSTYSFSSNKSSSFDYEVQYITPQAIPPEEDNSRRLTSALSIDEEEQSCLKESVTPVNSLQSETTPVNSPPPTDGQPALSYPACDATKATAVVAQLASPQDVVDILEYNLNLSENEIALVQHVKQSPQAETTTPPARRKTDSKKGNTHLADLCSATAKASENSAYGGESAISTGIDPVFQGVGQLPGIEVWRIESMKVIPVDKKTYGKFYKGDSYIVLHTERIKNRTEWHIHFWLGSETSLDEAGCAAIKTCELDDSLGGGPIQHREVQGYESERFQSIFKQGIQYLDGGVDSGFVKVSQLEFRKKLYHIKGRRKVRITQTEVSTDSLNEGDVFVLECKDTVWVWVGQDCSRLEKIKGMEFARKIKDDEKGGRATLILAEDKALRKKFYKEMGVTDTADVKIKTAAEGGEDDAVEQTNSEIALFRVCDESGKVEISEVGKAPLKYDMLDTNDAFILDMGSSGVYAWIGKGATQQERTQAFKNAESFLNDKGYPAWTPVCRVVEGAEDNLFRNCFSNWPKDPATVTAYNFMPNAVPKKEQKVSVDLSGLYNRQRKQEMLQDDIRDDGTGKIKIWRVEKFALVDVPENFYGTFWDGDSYVMLYTYIQPGKSHESFIVYFWLGSQSSQDEKGAAALHATKVDSEVGWSSQTIRVVQGKEPLHLLRVFDRRITVLRGGIDSGFNIVTLPETRVNGNVANNDSSSEKPKARMFHIKCLNEYVRNIEVDVRAESLNSNDSFLYMGQYKNYIWYGKGCDAEERYTAKMLVDKLDREELIGENSLGVKSVEIEEGNEPDEFWEVLGGKAEYASGEELENLVNERPPRLFQMSNASGIFSVEEIHNFNQDDLIEEDTMLLDTGNNLFVWIGKGANDIEKKQSLLAAKDYIQNDPSGRKESDINMYTVKQGMEPPIFTGHFQAWDSRKWSDGKSYKELEAQFGGIKSVDEELEKYSKKYSYEVLVKRIVPEGVDVVNKERYLADKDFTDIFKMTLEQYDALPKWKQIRAKKAVNLF